MRIRFAAIVLAVVGCLVGASTASAAPTPSVSLSGGIVTVAGKGQAETLVASGNSTSFTITDGDGIDAGNGCTQVSSTVVTCVGATKVVFDTSGGDDSVVATSLELPTTSMLGAGNDTFNGGTKSDFIDGESGDDAMAGGSGVDTVTYATRTEAIAADLDDSNDDGAIGEKDNVRSDVEVVLGGSGNDVLIGSSAANRLVGAAGDDFLLGYGAADRLVGGLGNDTITGGAGADVIKGGKGNDRLDGEKGRDIIEGGGGADRLEGRDRKKGDKLRGGTGFDHCFADHGDKSSSCNRLRLAD